MAHNTEQFRVSWETFVRSSKVRAASLQSLPPILMHTLAAPIDPERIVSSGWLSPSSPIPIYRLPKFHLFVVIETSFRARISVGLWVLLARRRIFGQDLDVFGFRRGLCSKFRIGTH